MKELEAQKDDLFRIDFVSDDKPENEKIHEESLVLKCDACDYTSKSKKGVSIHRGS